jgi:hypothetical protein
MPVLNLSFRSCGSTSTDKYPGHINYITPYVQNLNYSLVLLTLALVSQSQSTNFIRCKHVVYFRFLMINFIVYIKIVIIIIII